MTFQNWEKANGYFVKEHFYQTIILSLSVWPRYLSPTPSLEPKSLSNIQCEDSRPGVLHGGPVTRGHADLDGRHRHRGGGIHAVHGLGVVIRPRWRDISQYQLSRDILCSSSYGLRVGCCLVVVLVSVYIFYIFTRTLCLTWLHAVP